MTSPEYVVVYGTIMLGRQQNLSPLGKKRESLLCLCFGALLFGGSPSQLARLKSSDDITHP